MNGHDTTNSAGCAFRIGNWWADPSSCRLTSGETQIALEPKVMELLVFLVSREGRVASKAEILDRVWSGKFVVESVLTRAVSLLRAALGDSVREPTYIETIQRRGYRVIAPVEWLEPTGREHATMWALEIDTELVRLHPGDTIIGRGDDVDVFIDEVDVSRRHARITVSGTRAVLEDLGSKNGTILNGRVISGPADLSHLDVIVLSTVRLIVRARLSSVETESAPPTDV